MTLPATIPPNQFVSATATHADGSTSEFSLALPAGGVMDVPIQGLTAVHTTSGYSNDPVTFAASITAGTGVSYEWDLGDGSLAAGSFVEHTYTTPGIYTATVTASNNSSSAQAQTVVTVVEAANINGRVWNDLDLDGILGIGEGGLPGITVSAVGPTGTIQTTTDSDGRYQIFTPAPGLYTVSAAASNITPTTASPIPDTHERRRRHGRRLRPARNAARRFRHPRRAGLGRPGRLRLPRTGRRSRWPGCNSITTAGNIPSRPSPPTPTASSACSCPRAGICADDVRPRTFSAGASAERIFHLARSG